MSNLIIIHLMSEDLSFPDKIEARKKSVARGSDLRLLQGYNNSKIIP